ncbi:MAG: iron ABC transporter permease [Pseudomonadales bacterium]|nr:iron ABC transporter permease [Pseudomonadales bacterium]
MKPLIPPRQLYLCLSLMLLTAAIAALCIGAMTIPVTDIFKLLQALFLPDSAAGSTPEVSQIHRYVVVDIRLPRLVCAVVVGMGLAAAGVATQGLFRNPLADPSLIGVSNGAAVGAVSVIVMGPAITQYIPAAIALPVMAFIGGIIATMAVVAIATKNGQSDTALLLLAGVAINAVAGSGIGLLSYMADDNQLRDLTFWSMGSLAKAQWSELIIAAPIIFFATVALLSYRKVLNALLMGEAVAAHIGHDVKRCKRHIIILSTVIVATSVSISGVIFFVGLVVPHLIRLCVGSDHQKLLPLSMLLGAVIMLSCDLLARSLVSPAELPIGLLMSLVGGPFFIVLLIQQRQNRFKFA